MSLQPEPAPPGVVQHEFQWAALCPTCLAGWRLIREIATHDIRARTHELERVVVCESNHEFKLVGTIEIDGALSIVIPGPPLPAVMTVREVDEPCVRCHKPIQPGQAYVLDETAQKPKHVGCP